MKIDAPEFDIRATADSIRRRPSPLRAYRTLFVRPRGAGGGNGAEIGIASTPNLITERTAEQFERLRLMCSQNPRLFTGLQRTRPSDRSGRLGKENSGSVRGSNVCAVPPENAREAEK